MTDLNTIAARLHDAAMTANAVSQLDVELSLEQAYEVQRLSIDHRIAAGDRRIGIKMGLTSKAKMAQVGVDQMSWGRLTDGMLIDDAGTLPRGRYIHPRAEPEIAFRLKRPLEGRVTALEAYAAIESVAGAIEVIDSRYKDFKFRFSDSVADNASSCALVIGAWHSASIDFGNLGISLEVDGDPVEIGSSAAIMGHPIRSLVAAARLMAERGESLQAGDIVLSGSATAAKPLVAGTYVRARFEGLGQATFMVGE